MCLCMYAYTYKHIHIYSSFSQTSELRNIHSLSPVKYQMYQRCLWQVLAVTLGICHEMSEGCQEENVNCKIRH